MEVVLHLMGAWALVVGAGIVLFLFLALYMAILERIAKKGP
jgi:hypothetical protein